nr:hypothetical protein [Tanacetum cinerariifolium]
YECGDPLDGIFCKQCTCKSCGKDAYIGYNCPSKVSVISILKPCNNQTIDELPQALSIFHPEAKSPFTLDSTPTYVDESSNVFNPPPQPPVYPCEFCENDAQYGHYCTPQAPFNNPEPGYSQDLNFPQYTVNHPIFDAHNDFLKSQNDLFTSQNTIMKQMTQLTSMCELVCQIVQKKQEEKRIEEEQAANA